MRDVWMPRRVAASALSIRRRPREQARLSSWHAVFLAYVFLVASWRPNPMAWVTCRLSRICACGSRDRSHDQGVRAVRHAGGCFGPRRKGVSPLAPNRCVHCCSSRTWAFIAPGMVAPAVCVGDSLCGVARRARGWL